MSQHRDKSTCLDERSSRQIEMQASRLASLLAQKPDDTIEIDLDLDELDATSAELKATYQEIKDYARRVRSSAGRCSSPDRAPAPRKTGGSA